MLSIPIAPGQMHQALRSAHFGCLLIVLFRLNGILLQISSRQEGVRQLQHGLHLPQLCGTPKPVDRGGSGGLHAQAVPIAVAELKTGLPVFADGGLLKQVCRKLHLSLLPVEHSQRRLRQHVPLK